MQIQIRLLTTSNQQYLKQLHTIQQCIVSIHIICDFGIVRCTRILYIYITIGITHVHKFAKCANFNNY